MLIVLKLMVEKLSMYAIVAYLGGIQAHPSKSPTFPIPKAQTGTRRHKIRATAQPIRLFCTPDKQKQGRKCENSNGKGKKPTRSKRNNVSSWMEKHDTDTGSPETELRDIRLHPTIPNGIERRSGPFFKPALRLSIGGRSFGFGFHISSTNRSHPITRDTNLTRLFGAPNYLHS
ncbi:hypothetical protein F5B18DRAFT_573113 [Nemania serpens]|nr:hypothetical protein F5B18DRAFT_573113 [Nemania serpens]